MCALVLHNPWLLISYYMHDISCNRNIVLYRRYNLVMLIRSLTTTTFASFRLPLHYHKPIVAIVDNILLSSLVVLFSLL